MSDRAGSQFTWRDWIGPLAVGAVVSTAVLVVFQVDPQTVDWLPKCPFNVLTGWHCPGCGSTRAAHALLHGDVAAALAKNPLLVIGAPVGLIVVAVERYRKGPRWALTVHRGWVWLVFALLVGFTLLRNLPVYPFQLLAPH